MKTILVLAALGLLTLTGCIICHIDECRIEQLPLDRGFTIHKIDQPKK